MGDSQRGFLSYLIQIFNIYRNLLQQQFPFCFCQYIFWHRHNFSNCSIGIICVRIYFANIISGGLFCNTQNFERSFGGTSAQLPSYADSLGSSTFVERVWPACNREMKRLLRIYSRCFLRKDREPIPISSANRTKALKTAGSVPAYPILSAVLLL